MKSFEGTTSMQRRGGYERTSQAAKLVSLAPEYLAAIREVEGLPRNQDRADKSWVYRAVEDSRRYFARVQRV
jgi:hypothetical protein